MNLPYKYSFFAALLIILATISVQFNNKAWETDFGVVQADVKGYYAYLPLLFIYNDIEVNNPSDYAYKNDHRLWYSMASDGTRYIKYTAGVAILYAPFFFIAHATAGIFGYSMDGFSMPYQIMLLMSAIFYLVLGIFILRKLLLLYFKDQLVAVGLVVLYAGTNLFYFYSVEMCVSHGYSFTLITMFLYGTVRWLDVPKMKWALIIGISSGLMILIRPIDGIFLLFVVLYKISGVETFKTRIGFLWRNAKQVLFAVLLAFLVIVPQLIYWKYISGSFLFFSYSGEHFYFLNPNILWSMFSFKNGWLIYSPLMIIGLAGIVLVRKRKPEFFLPLLVIVPVYIYVISSWWCWWYGGFGNRAFVNLYPLLSVPLVIIIQYFSERSKVIQYGIALLLVFFIMLSVFQTYQTSKGVIHYSDMTKKAYWDSFGRTKRSELFPTYLRKLDPDSAKKGVYYKMEPKYTLLIDEVLNPGLNENNQYLKCKNEQVDDNEQFLGEQTWHSPEGNHYTLNVKFPLLDADEVYISVWVKNSKSLSLGLKSNDSIPFFEASDEYMESRGSWKKMNLFTRLKNLNKPDSLVFYISNRTENEIWMDNFRVTTRKVNFIPEEIKSCAY